MVRRQRTVVGNPDECSSSPRHGSPRHSSPRRGSPRHSSPRRSSPRHTLSPRSIGSDSSFQVGSNGSLSFGGSIIGHDDPTLVHTNIHKKQLRNDEFIKHVNSEALDSFLTATFSEEERRDSMGDVKRSNQSLHGDELRHELVELDRAQNAWREKQQMGSGSGSDDMDETGNFYVKEVGEFTPSARKKTSFVFNEETIYEEVAERCEPNHEEAADRFQPKHDEEDHANIDVSDAKPIESFAVQFHDDIQFHDGIRQTRDDEIRPDAQFHSGSRQRREPEIRPNIQLHNGIQLPQETEIRSDIQFHGNIQEHGEPEVRADIQFHDDIQQQGEPKIHPDATSNQSHEPKMEMVEKAKSPRMQPCQIQTVPGIAPDLSSRQHQTKDDIVDSSYDQSPQKPTRESSVPPVKRDQTDEYRTQQAVACSILYEPYQQETQETISVIASGEKQKGISEKNNPSAVDSGAHIERSATGQSEESELDFEYPSTDEQSDTSKRNELSAAYVDTAVTCGRATNRPNVINLEENVDFSNTLKSVQPEDTDRIVRAVQERLFDFSSSNPSEVPHATNHPEQPSIQENDKPGLFVGMSSPRASGISTLNMWTKTQALASQVDRSNDEDDVDANSGYNPRKRRLKLCMLNGCVVLVVIVAIICATFLALELRGSRNKGGSTTNENNNIQQNTSTAPTTSPVQSALTETDHPITLENRLADESSPVYSESYTRFPTDTPSLSPVYSESYTQFPTDTPSLSPVYSEFYTQFPTDTPSLSPVYSEFYTQFPTGSPSLLHSLEPTPYSSSKEEKLFNISGESVFNTSTPQHAAYDWVLAKDQAKTEQELTERYIAALFYFAMNGYDWVEQYGFLDESHVCDWNNGSARNKMGIICNDSDRITGFVINENNLRGQLPGELQELTDLTLFRLRSNNVYGTLPSGFGRLSMLEEIDLRQNELIGTISESIFNLPHIKRILLLRNSQLRGTIPATIEKASSLEMLSFQRCQMTGSIPSTIGNLSNLFFLTFMENLLTGSIPDSLANLSNLEVLELSGNQLTGSIPDLANQESLYFISLFDNELIGYIPTTLGALPSLMFLDIRNNELDGSIPPQIGRLPDLVTLFAENNELTGTLPSFSGNNGLLQAISLSGNKLSGDLGAFFGPDGPNERLVTIDLAHNNFAGSIPSTIGMFNALSELNLRGNSITGTIPTEIGSLREMDTLNLQENDLIGTLPEELGLVEQLIYLNVAGNEFEGTIPDTLVMLSRLTVLDLSSNELVGNIPTIFGQLSNLDELYLNNNNLIGDMTQTFCKHPNSDPTFKIVGTFAADCLEPNPVVDCSCCTVCCNDGDCINKAKLPSK